MCGIIGYAGKSVKTFNLDKFNILGIWNETRGKHSCGITMDGDIQVGVDDTKVWRDFASTGLSNPTMFPTVIGHTRHATGGAHNANNAHPFGYGNIGAEDMPMYEFVGVHNGSLLNHRELAAKRNIEVSVLDNAIQNSFRNKIDSEILLECIYNDKNYTVLSEYNGAAALVFTNINEPNVVYCYHGKSQASDLSSAALTEERPLYYYKESKNSLYISSIEDSLYCIGGTKATVGEFEHNTIYKIKDGDVDNAETVRISRKGRFQKEYTTGWSRSGSRSSFNSATKNTTPSNNVKKTSAQKVLDNINIIMSKGIKFEHLESNNSAALQFKKLRYYRNNHLAQGIYIWIQGYGLKHVGATFTQAVKNVMQFRGMFFYENTFTNKKLHTGCVQAIPENITEEEVPQLFHYFYQGMRLKTKLDWEYVPKLALSDYETLSSAVAHPIINLTEQDPTVYFEGAVANDLTIQILGAERTYCFVDGKLLYAEVTKMEPLQKEDDKKAAEKEGQVINLPSLNTVSVASRECCDTTDPLFDKLPNDEKVDLILTEALTDVFYDLPDYMQKLKPFLDKNVLAKNAYKTMETFLEDITMFNYIKY